MIAEPASAAPGRQPPRRRWVAWVVVAVLAAALRGLFPTADPPWRATVGVVWHDEGAWTHNARNRALWGTWRTDDWNPMYVAPVFTGLEYASFATFGVGTWQARLVPMTLGVVAVLALGWGVARVGGRRAGIAASLLLATNFVATSYDRAAIMEGPMSAAIVIGWWAFARAQAHPAFGAVAGAAAIAAYFVKAAAVFFVGALGLTALIAVLLPGPPGDRRRPAGLWTLAGLAVAGAVALAVFVVPEWTEYRFYNWQMSVTRKPSYDAQSLLNRVSWFPVLHDLLSRMWIVVVLGLCAFVARALDWFRRPPAEQLLVLWVAVGVLELLLHDVGNERRFVFLIPAFVALGALAISGDRALVPAWLGPLRAWQRLLLVPLALYAAYVAAGSLVRLAFLYEVRPAVRWGAALAATGAVAVWVGRGRLAGAVRRPWTPAASLLVVGLLTAGGLAQFVQYAAGRSYENIEASRELGRRLPPGALVHGKLANGLALENRIRPIFVGRQFGNYEDRLSRNDVPWLLTYVAPRTGYEGPVILDVLAAYPEHRRVWTFDVAETTSGNDRAALIAKGPPAVPAVATPSLHARPDP
nr:dolichyl-phosphate-mannose-protein mannosyltransferase [uncultured bacterium]